jgi:ribonuclease BN (tRNA processing enzyme)
MIRTDRFRRLRVLGTGTGLATPRYWSGLLVDEDVLLDAPPTAGIHLRRMGADAADLRYIFISHLHADHAFGLAFLCLEFHFERPRAAPLTIVGPVGIRRYVETLYQLAYPFDGTHPPGAHPLPLEFREVAGPADLTFERLSCRAIPVTHHSAQLHSYGYRLTRGGRTIAYSGDTAAIEPVADLAAGSDLLIVECTNLEGNHGDHLCVRDLAELREKLPARTKIWVTHTQGVIQGDLPRGTTLMQDFDALTI